MKHIRDMTPEEYRCALFSMAVQAPDMFCEFHLKWAVENEEYEIAAYLKNRMDAKDYDPSKKSHPHYSSPLTAKAECLQE